jgi:hypothetical protein
MVLTYDLILPVFLFCAIFSVACLFLYDPKHPFISFDRTNFSQNLLSSNILAAQSGEKLIFIATDLTKNLLSGQLFGQFYQLTCDLADAPPTSLCGQSYQFLCLLSDVPEAYLQGQVYRLSCDLAEAPTSSLQGQFYALASVYTPTWHSFYRQNLGKPKINYWQWRSYPEVNHICRELTLLLGLPMPTKYTREILESLAGDRGLFLFCSNSLEFDYDAKFARRSPQVQQQMRRTFKKWHDTGCKALGQEMMAAIYRVCYGKNWSIITEIVNDAEPFHITESDPWWKVLGVKVTASSAEVETAYKRSIRMWHPDLNKHPDATTITTLINIAYDKYRSIELKPKISVDRTPPANRKIFHKLQDWLKPIFSR